MNRSSLRFTPSLESLDERINLSAGPQPVLMVLADQRDFSLSESRVQTPHVGGMLVGLGDGSVRGVKSTDDAGYGGTHVLYQDIPVPAASAVVFVGGWGSSMYQY